MEDAIVMKLPKLTSRVSRLNRLTIDVSNVELRVLPSQASIPAAIAGKLASDYAIDEVTGLAQCVGTLAGILDVYQQCVDRGGNVNCENIAARQIAEYACRSYCTCN